MTECVNPNCTKDPLQYNTCCAVNSDGDLACCPKCKAVYLRHLEDLKHQQETAIDEIELTELFI
jgi:hypothetical protein